MSWLKVGFKDDISYIASGATRMFREMESLSLDDLNDHNRSFSMTYNPKYIAEHVETVEENTVDLPNGLYKLVAPSIYDEWKLMPWSLPNTTKLFKLDVVAEVINDFDQFRTQEELYKRLHVAYKRGIMLYGPPGTGKTSAIQMIIESLKLDNALVFFIEGALPLDFLQELKHESRLKVFIFEELTQTIDRANIARFLTFLDGEHSLENAYVIATTNYPEQLPGNIVNRPGRFDKLVRIESISLKDRKTYMEHFLSRKLTAAELKSCEKYPMAHLKELMLIMMKENISVTQAKKQIDLHQRIAKSNFKKSQAELGFREDD